VQARSVIPGRQRWDIGIVLASPRVAEFLEGRLRQTPGVVVVHANPISGRLLTVIESHIQAIRAQKQQPRRAAWLFSFPVLLAA